MKKSEILIKSKELISNPKNWTQGMFARDEYGTPVPSISENACSWCSAGAVIKVANNIYVAISLFALLEKSISRAIAPFNDNPESTHEDIMNMFDKAIELAKAEET